LIGHYSDFPRDPEDICYIDNRNFAVSLKSFEKRAVEYIEAFKAPGSRVERSYQGYPGPENIGLPDNPWVSVF